MNFPPHSRMILAAAALLAAAGCGEQNQQAGGGFQRPPTPVEAEAVSVRQVTDRFTTVGTIEADLSIAVATEVDGIVTDLPFREGGPVQQGELVAQLDDRQRAAEVRRARALQEQAQATWQRVRNVVDQGAGAPQDLDDATAALKVADANLALAETYLAKTRITAPFGGLAGTREISRGAFLRAGETITTLARIDRLRVTFAVPEQILGSVQLGAQVSVTTTAYPDRPLTGVIDVIEPQLDQLTRNAGVVALVENGDGLLRPGMSATVEVVLHQRAGALTVPSQAVFVEGGQAFVYVVQPDSTVLRTAIELGTRLAAVVEITAGLTDRQQVVTAGHQKLYPGAKVAPLGTAGPEGGAAR